MSRIRMASGQWLISSGSVAVIFLAMSTQFACAQQVGECWRVKATHADGVPVHSESHNSFTGQRIPDQAVVSILERKSDGKWFRVRGGITEGWVSSKYLDAVAPCAPLSDPDDVAPGGNTDTSSIVVGTWNIEHMKENTKRGFPEYQGNNALPARGDAECQNLAKIITDLNLKLVLLQEINGFSPSDDEDAEPRSNELDKLVTKLQPRRYNYVIGSAGGAQRLAILFDEDVVQLMWSCETDFDNTKVQGKGLFDRQPLLGYFRVFAEGVEKNDLVVVAVHLASGQDKNQNHDKAMDIIVDWIGDERKPNGCVPPGEFDVLIGGDFNANRFDDRFETFWGDMEGNGWDVLANDNSYPATRLSGNPPAQRTSKIDYLVITKGNGGLGGEEVTMTTAHVHDELVTQLGGGMDFRKKASDHLPVTVNLAVGADND